MDEEKFTALSNQGYIALDPTEAKEGLETSTPRLLSVRVFTHHTTGGLAFTSSPVSIYVDI